MLTRRGILQAGGRLAAASVLLPPSIRRGWAATGLDLGDLRIDILSDGHLVLPGDFLFADLDPADLAPILERYDVSPERLEPDCNLTLVRDAERTILFDVGAGPHFMPTAGKLLEAMEAIALDPSEVTHVVFTHAHPDHLWGLTDDFDEPLFAEAQYMIARPEWDYWTDPGTIDTISEARKVFAAGAARHLASIGERMVLFADGEEILPGILARATHGHTPGHTSFELRSGSSSAMIVGDAIANHHVAFERPQWPSGADQDAVQGAATRSMLLDQISAERIQLIGFHLPYPGIGHAEAKDGGYRFVAS